MTAALESIAPMTGIETGTNLFHLNHPLEFQTGARVLLHVQRNKDGLGNKTLKRVATTGQEQFQEQLEKLRSVMEPGQRIYGSVDARNVDAAIRKFKESQLEFDYHPTAVRRDYYFKLDSTWKSCLMSPSARATKLFLFDLDTPEERDEFFEAYNALIAADPLANLQLKGYYATKNGWHVITTPFNITKLPVKLRACHQTNAVMLWSY